MTGLSTLVQQPQQTSRASVGNHGWRLAGVGLGGAEDGGEAEGAVEVAGGRVGVGEDDQAVAGAGVGPVGGDAEEVGGEAAATVRLGGDHGLVGGEGLTAIDDTGGGWQGGAVEGAQGTG